MQSRLDDFKTLRADVLAISMDTPANNRKASKKLQLGFPILADPDGIVVDQFGVRHPNGMPGRDIARPGVFVLDEQHRVVWRSLTDNWRVRVRPEDIIDALGALSNPPQ